MTATSAIFISSWVPSRVTVVIQPMLPAGAPARARRRHQSRTVCVMQRAREGCGLMTIGQRAFSAMSTL
jgi:hypothetical protein